MTAVDPEMVVIYGYQFGKSVVEQEMRVADLPPNATRALREAKSIDDVTNGVFHLFEIAGQPELWWWLRRPAGERR